jgi:TP901 family phage tail tape measure protein
MTIAGGAIVGALGLVGHAAADFEAEMANVNTMLSQQSEHLLPQYAEGVKNLSLELGESTSTLSKGLYDILSASVDAEKAMRVLEVSARAARGGLTDTGVSADAITTILNAYGWEAERAGEISDKLFAIVKRGKTTYGQLAPSIGKVATLAASSGLSFDELGASIATLTRAGINTDEAMTAIRGVLNNFLSPAKEAREAAAKLGFELNTTTLKSMGLIGVFNKLKDASSEQIAALAPNIRALVGFQSVLQQLAGYEYDVAFMANSAGIAQEAFAKNSATAEHAMQQLKASFKIARIELGSALLPVIEDLSEKIVEYVKRLREWIKENPELIKSLMDMSVYFAKLLVTIGPMIILTGKLLTLWKGLKTATTAINLIFTGLNLTSMRLVGTLGLVGIALAALQVAVIHYKNTMSLVDSTNKQIAESNEGVLNSVQRSQVAWKEYASIVENSNEKITYAIKKAKIEQQLVETGKQLDDLKVKTQDFGFFTSEETKKWITDAIKLKQAERELLKERLDGLTEEWMVYTSNETARRKKEQEEKDKADAPSIVTDEMKEQFEEVQKALSVLRNGERIAELGELETWFKEQQKAWKGHTEELATIEEFYYTRKAQLQRESGQEIIEQLQKEVSARQKSIETTNELAESGLLYFGEAQAKNREELSKLSVAAEKARQKLADLFADQPKLVEEFNEQVNSVIGGMNTMTDNARDKIGSVFTGFQAGVRNATDGLYEWANVGIQAGEMVTESISGGVADAFVGAIQGTKDFGDAMREMASSVLADLAKMIIKAIVLRSIMSAFGFNSGGEVPAIERASGGVIPGIRTHADTVNARLTPGEFVLREKATDYYERAGNGILTALNNMRIPLEVLRPFSKGIGPLNTSRFFQTGGSVASSAKQSITPAYIVANNQTLDRLLAGGRSAMLGWMESEKTTIRSILQ